MQLTFCGAARSVTGSCYLLEAAGKRLLIDCGLFQEWALKARNWDAFPFNPSTIDAVLLTHAHIDHSGRLPLLVKRGFAGPIYCTRATADLTELLLLDSAHIQEEDARFKTKRHRREQRDLPTTEPLYRTPDAEAAIGQLAGVAYQKPFPIFPGITATWQDAGHMLGSGHVRVTVTEGDQTRSVVFSGDIGVAERPILRDPEPYRSADVVVCETTYGDRLHEPVASAVEKLRDVVNTTLDRGGNLIIPAFAVGRTQTILYHLRQLMAQDAIPPVTTFVDSPMAVRATSIFRHHPECYDEAAAALVEDGHDPVGFEPLHFSRTVESSKAINRIKGGSIIISASGMCTAGRIKHHLVHNIGRPDCTILFAGYQANGTLGRQILEGENPVRILGEIHRVRARIETINGLSGHADRDMLLAWLGHLEQPPGRLFLTHGDEAVALHFAETVKAELGWTAEVPDYQQTVTV